MSGARRLAALYRTVGPAKLAARLLRRAAAIVYVRHTELVLVKRLDEARRGPRDPRGVRIRPISAADAPMLRRFNATYRSTRKVLASQRYLDLGYSGFLGLLGEHVIGYWWWVTNRVAPAVTHPCVARFDVTLADDEVFAFDYFVAPDYRAQGAAVRFLVLIYDELARLGYRGVWGSVDADNAGARWVYGALGNRIVRRNVGHELLASLLIQDRRVFVRNTRWNPTHPFERRLLVSFPAKTATPADAGVVAHGVSPHGI